VNQVDDKTLRLTLVEAITSLPPALQRWGLAVTAPGRLLFRYGPSRT
jgi:hypothetical protein